MLIKTQLNNIMKYKSVRIWSGFIVFFFAASLVTQFFLDRYRGYGIETSPGRYDIKYKVSGIIFYGGSSIFLTLLVISGICFVFLCLYAFIFSKSRFISQLTLAIIFFLLLCVLSFFYASPLAEFKAEVYDDDATSVSYIWSWHKKRVPGIMPTKTFSGSSTSYSLYINRFNKQEVYRCKEETVSWLGSFQKK